MNQCDLYPVLPSLHALTDLQAELPSLLAADNVTALRLCFDRPIEQAMLATLCDIVQAQDVALILAPMEFSLLKGLSLSKIDGVHLLSPADVKTFTSKKDHPQNLQVGCGCLTLDDAMSAGERGADYVSLPATALTALTQWNLIAELPAVAEDITTVEDAQAAIQAGADFLAIPLTPTNEAVTRFETLRAALSE